VFVDVFEQTDLTPDHRAGALRALYVDAEHDVHFVVRVQPELFREGRLHVAGRVGPSLLFPVAGAGVDDLKSIFGDQRDAGRRRHEGVDIFAKRGTPVLSASNGIVTSVNETAIGGRVVWVWAPARSLMLYYAHLDEQLVASGTRVNAGDVIGTVGNTGNARTTDPHLHFGIYERGSGAIDPDAFIRPVTRGF
jgi:peptidoglycan LD-endopeptidase LytH